MADPLSDKYAFKQNMLSFVLECNERNGTYDVSDQYGLRECYGNASYYEIALVQSPRNEIIADEYGEYEEPGGVSSHQYQPTFKMGVKVNADAKKEDLYPTVQGIVQIAAGMAKMRKTPFIVQFLVPEVVSDPWEDPVSNIHVMQHRIAYEFLLDADEIGSIPNEDERLYDLAVEAGLFVTEAKKFEKDFDSAIWEARDMNEKRLSHYRQ